MPGSVSTLFLVAALHPTVSQQLSPVVLALKLRLGLIELKIPISGSPWKAHKLKTRSVKAQPWPQLAAVGAVAGGTASPAAPGEAQEQTAPCVRGRAGARPLTESLERGEAQVWEHLLGPGGSAGCPQAAQGFGCSFQKPVAVPQFPSHPQTSS